MILLFWRRRKKARVVAIKQTIKVDRIVKFTVKAGEGLDV